jgi:hypothetical protein
MFNVYLRNVPACILFSTLLMPCVSAQEMSTVPDRLTIPDGTPIQLQLAENVTSAHARVGDHLDFVVVKDVSVDGLRVVPTITAIKQPFLLHNLLRGTAESQSALSLSERADCGFSSFHGR